MTIDEWATRKVREVVLTAMFDALPTKELKEEFLRRLEASRQQQLQIKNSQGLPPGEAGTTAP
jgi:hypothetical protein